MKRFTFKKLNEEINTYIEKKAHLKLILMLVLWMLADLGVSSGVARQRIGGRRPEVSRPVQNRPAQGRPLNTKPRSKPLQNRNNVAGNRLNTNNRVNTINNNNRNNINTGNQSININVDRSRNININNNVISQRGYRPYTRPPYVYGGHAYYSYHPYYYHPYHPYYWGPAYHPWGYFLARLTTAAIVISVASHQYHYDQGVYYVSSGSGYTVVQAPVGAVITTLPQGAQTVVVNETTNNYYYGGTFYAKNPKGYAVVAPTAGTIVQSLPEGGKEVKIGNITYVKYGDTYYQPIQKDGKNCYEVVQVEVQQ